jgi:hypothetical protein
VYLAYIDESGSTGDVVKGGSKSYTLGCVLIRAAQWHATLDALIGYRRYVKNQFGLLARAEIKANYLLQNGGAFRDLALSERARHSIYRGMLRLCPKIDIKAFAIVIRKDLLVASDPHDRAWTFLLQRLERLTTKDGTQVVVFHDEGDEQRVRALARKARRAGMAGSAFGPGWRNVPFRGLVDGEPPFPRILVPTVGRSRGLRGVPTRLSAPGENGADRSGGDVGRARRREDGGGQPALRGAEAQASSPGQNERAPFRRL